VIAVVPAVLVAWWVASVNLDRGLDRLFLDPATAPSWKNSVIVSQAYLNEHQRSIQAETNFMAADIARAKPQFDQDIDRFRQLFTTQALLRNMPAAMMLRSDQSIIVKADIRLPPQVQDRRCRGRAAGRDRRCRGGRRHAAGIPITSARSSS